MGKVITLENLAHYHKKIKEQLNKKQDVISAVAKLNADLVDDSSSNNKFVSAADKTTWNGKQDAISVTNKLNADFVDDSNSNNKFVSAQEKTAWNGKQNEITNANKLSANLVEDNENKRFVSDTEKTTWSRKQDAITSGTKLNADLVDDTNANHKFVSATEKSTWTGKQDAITPNAKLSADLVDDTNSNNKFVTDSEKTTWNNKQDALTFDSAPTTGSDNPVKSSGVKTALETLSNSVYNKNEASALFAAKEDVTRVSLDQTDIVEIDSDAKMLEFADRVNSGTTFEGKIVRLTADVNLNTNIGNTSSKPFMGCFDGQGHTVTINQTYVNPDGIGGLFSFVRTPASGSVYIKDVRVTGRINASNTNANCGYFGGLISCADGNTSGTGGTINISNVQNSVYINCGQSNLWTGVGGMVGFVRHADGLKPLTLNFESCLWDGVINVGPAAYNFGGYIGYTGNNKIGRTLNINIKNCAASGKIAINQNWNQTVGTLIGYAKGNFSDDATAKITINIINVVSNSYMTFQTGTPGSGSAIGHIGEINGTTELNVTNLYYKAFSRGAISGGAPVLGGGTATSVTNAVVKTDTEFAALVYDSFPSSASWDADKWALLPNVYYPCPRRIFAQFGPPSSLYYVATT